jgi:hypothetical protein
MTPFGAEWTDALVDGAASLGVHVEWILATIALESGFNPRARSQAGAFGLCQRMPRDGVPYAQTDPVRQLRDGIGFWRDMIDTMRTGVILSREAFYCLNLAPARLRHGDYDDDTVIYAAPGDAYRMNAAPFGCDPRAPQGRILMRDLAHGLDRAIVNCRGRYDAELALAREHETLPARDYAPNLQPAAVEERERKA